MNLTNLSFSVPHLAWIPSKGLREALQFWFHNCVGFFLNKHPHPKLCKLLAHKHLNQVLALGNLIHLMT